MGQFHSKVAGITAINSNGISRQNYIRTYCKPEMNVILKREPENQHDSNAVAVWIKARAFIFFSAEVQIGYINNGIAGEISRHLENGGKVNAKITDITKGASEDQYLDVDILINTK